MSKTCKALKLKLTQHQPTMISAFQNQETIADAYLPGTAWLAVNGYSSTKNQALWVQGTFSSIDPVGFFGRIHTGGTADGDLDPSQKAGVVRRQVGSFDDLL